MKKFIFVFMAVIVCMSFAFHASSVEIDGIDSGEWHDAMTYVLINGESNSGVYYGLVKVKFDTENSALYICAMMLDKNLTADNLNAGASVSVNGSANFTVTGNNTPCNDDIDNYSFDGAVYVDGNNGATTEMRIGFKNGVPQTVDCVIRFIDSNGEPSNYYNLNLINESYVETTEMVISPTKDNTDPVYNPEILNTTVKTYTTKKQTVATTKRKKKTTTVPSTTERWTVPDSPMFYTGRTKAEKTVKQQVVTVPNGGVTVYYYEKEVVISQVPVILTAAEVSSETSILSSSAVQAVTSSAVSSDTKSYTDETVTAVSLSQSAKYQKIILALGAAAFVVISCFGVRLVKKKTD